MAFDSKWHHRFNICVEMVLSKGVIAVVIEPDVFIETTYNTYKLSIDEASEFIEALVSLTFTSGHTRNECALYLAYDFIGAVVPDHR